MTHQQRLQVEEERLSIIAQLQKWDHHGVWTDEQSKGEGFSNMTLHEARGKLAYIMDPKNH